METVLDLQVKWRELADLDLVSDVGGGGSACSFVSAIFGVGCHGSGTACI
jgi:hypothetical protein